MIELIAKKRQNAATWKLIGIVLLLAVLGGALAANGRPTAAAPISDSAPPSKADGPAALAFADSGIVLPGVRNSALAWGDYDNDGRLDLLLTGFSANRNLTKLYHQKSDGTFEDKTAALIGGVPQVFSGAVAWGDYDNDGRLDFLLTGCTNSNCEHIYDALFHQKSDGTFEDKTSLVAGNSLAAGGSAVAWGDYDNDGRLDFLITGCNSLTGRHPNCVASFSSKLYHQKSNGTFEDKSSIVAGGTMPAVYNGAVAWGDYDHDGRLDFLLAGYTTHSAAASKLYHQKSDGTFEDMSSIVAGGLTGLTRVALAWGDYDNDGRLDFLFTGCTNSNCNSTIQSKLYHQKSDGTFEDKSSIVAGGTMPNVNTGSLSWGDYDNDGRLDFLLTGCIDAVCNNEVTKLYHQKSDGTFEDGTASIPSVPNVGYSAAAWGDYDGDGKLDFLLTGCTNSNCSGYYTTKLYHNVGSVANSLPAAPGGLTATASGGAATFHWIAPTDAQTPANGLSYNLRVGTSPGASDLFSTMADTSNGKRRLPMRGPIQGTSFTLQGFSTPGTYYWGVQAIDTSLAGGPFAAGFVTVAGATYTRTPTNTTTPTTTNTPTATVTGTPTVTSTPTLVVPVQTCQNVVWFNPVNVTVATNNLTKTTTSGWNGGAISSQGILSGNGRVQMTVADLNSYVMFGLSNGDTNQSNGDIDYTMYTYPPTNDLYIYQFGKSFGTVHGYAVGDVLRVGIDNGIIKFYRNDTIIYSSTIYISRLHYPLQLDSSLSNSGAKLSNAQICGNDQGIVSTPPTNTPTATATPVLEDVVWTNAVQVAVSGNSLTKQVTSGWNGGAASTRAITAGDGFASAVVSDTTSYYMFGLSDADSNQSYTDIEYALYAYPGTQELIIYESGHNIGFFGGYDVGDVLKVAVEVGVVNYYRNAILLYSSNIAPSYPLLVDSSLSNLGALLYNVKIQGGTLGAANLIANAHADSKNADCKTSFSDVAADAYYSKAARNLACAGAISGYADGTFKPFAPTTRGQLLKMLALANGWALINSAKPTFADVSASNPFYLYVETAAAWHIVGGYGDGTFRPNAPVSRAQLAKIVVAGMAWPLDTTGGPHFSDVPQSSPFYQYVETAYHNGLISGYADGTFRPGAGATRGQVAKIINAVVPLDR